MLNNKGNVNLHSIIWLLNKLLVVQFLYQLVSLLLLGVKYKTFYLSTVAQK